MLTCQCDAAHKDIPPRSLARLPSEVSRLLLQSLFKQRNCISFFFFLSVNHTSKLEKKTCPPTHCFEQKYIPHIPGTFISALTQRPTRLAAECQKPRQPPCRCPQVFQNWSSSLLYTCDLISCLFFWGVGGVGLAERLT